MSKKLSKEEINSMRKMHSDFVAKTNADPALAQDLLDATEWNMEAALEAFKGLNVTYVEQADSNEIDDTAVAGLLSEQSKPLSVVDETMPWTEGDVLQRPKKTNKRPKAMGLGHVAEKVEDMFIKVAVSESKLKAGANKKEKVFDEQFFTHSFLHPDLSLLSDDLRSFIESDIVERSHKHILTKAGRLNWWSSTGKLPVLEPLATTGDGNCLLHAASLYMWGLPDSYLILRTHLHRILTSGLEKEAIQRRWKYATDLRNQEAGGLVFSDEEWEFEWSEMVRIATDKPRRRPTTDSLKRYSTLRTHYESLEEIHVFAMAHVLRRPIIVVADEYIRDANGEPFAPVYFGGIYLPIECAPSSCYNSPLILAFESSHFSPLVAKRDPVISQGIGSASSSGKGLLRHLPSRQDTMMPLVTPDGSLLPLQFVYDPKKKNISEKWAKEKCQLDDFPDEVRVLLESYLDIRWIQLNIGGSKSKPAEAVEGFQGKVPKFRFPAAVVSVTGEPEYQSVLVSEYIEDAKERLKVVKEREQKVAAQKARQEEEFKRIQASRPVPCKGEGCTMFGTNSNNGYCSMCFAKTKQATLNNVSSENQLTENTDSTIQQPTTVPKTNSSPERKGKDNEFTKPITSYPNNWDIHLPDVVAERAHVTNDDDTGNDSSITLISHTSTVKDDANPQNNAPPAVKQVPSKSSPKSPVKIFPNKAPQKVPDPPPRSPPKSHPPQTNLSSSDQAINPPLTDAVSKPSRPPPPDQPVNPPLKHVSKPSRPPPPPVRHNNKPSTSSTGYSRDNIKPLSCIDSGRAKCSGGCGFYGSDKFNGMCSQCYRNMASTTNTPSVTQV